MAQDHYQDLIEVQSLDKQIKKHLDAIRENNQRIELLEKQRQNKDDKLQDSIKLQKSLTNEISQLEKDLSEAENKLTKSNEHISNAINQQQIDAITNEINTLKPKIESLENLILEKIEESEQNSNFIEQTNKFLSGSLESLSELQNEVKTDNQKEEAEIAILENRINLLMANIPNTFKESFNESQKAHRFNHPLAFINHGRCCNQCRFALDVVIQDNVTKGLNPEQCPSCGRLLLPLSASTSGS